MCSTVALAADAADDEPRAAIVAVLDTAEGPVTVLATHLTLIPGWNVLQLRYALRHVRDLPQPLVVLGDLNLEGTWPAWATTPCWPPTSEPATFAAS